MFKSKAITFAFLRNHGFNKELEYHFEATNGNDKDFYLLAQVNEKENGDKDGFSMGVFIEDNYDTGHWLYDGSKITESQFENICIVFFGKKL